ncbi:unnamed protein product [Linum tenue]|uniref:Xylanase inhibitor N-terminal domain-containing protein n=1 Tax=Linum tenue TaxID=586396 RepID=A0AAV0P592_9ROSI|nr:unnamed protein product [Linum tenue]
MRTKTKVAELSPLSNGHSVLVVDNGIVGRETKSNKKSSGPRVSNSLPLSSCSTSRSQPLKQLPSYTNGFVDHGDRATNQILTHLHIGTPAITRTFIVDLAGQIPWLDCYTTAKYSASTSSTHRLAKCGSASCSVTAASCSGICHSASGPDCHNNTCQLLTRNPIRNANSLSEVAVDTVSLRSTIGGGRAGKHVSIPNFILACDDSYHLGHLAAGVVGSVGLARSRVSVPSQLSSAATLAAKFAICLPSSPDSNVLRRFSLRFLPFRQRNPLK